MNWNWPSRQGNNVLTDTATNAETRLKAIKRSLKSLRKGIEDSLRTSNSRSKGNDELEVRKKRCAEFILGENVAGAVHMLNEEKGVNMSCFSSPLNTILERYANFEKTVGHMLAVNEMEIASFLNSDTPIARLLDKEIPAVQAAKKDLEQVTKKLQSAQSTLEKESKKLEKMKEEENSSSSNISEDAIHQQEEKKEKLTYDVEKLDKEVTLEQDKLTSTLLTLVSRENRYASSLLELMRIKKQFYENAFNVISVELPNIERILNETHLRPVFGERLEDHLQAYGRPIAYPIRLSVKQLRESGLSDEGLFRISPKQIKLDKVKAFIDSNMPFEELLADGDSHLYSALLKSYLRELPEPLLGRKKSDVYNMWLEVALLRDNARVTGIKRILKEELPPCVVYNIQYLVKFLHELSKNSEITKMTPFNIAIVLGPTLLWSQVASSISEQGNIEKIISVVTTLIDNYNLIFPNDHDWTEFEDEAPKQFVGAVKNDIYTGEVCNLHDTKDGGGGGGGGGDRQSRPNSSPPISESQSPLHKRSNIFKSKFLSKINPPSSPKSIAEEHIVAPTVQINDM